MQKRSDINGAEGVVEGNETAGVQCDGSTLFYDCKTWTVQKRHVSRLQACEMMYVCEE